MRAGFDNRWRMGQMPWSVARDAVRRFFTAPWRSAAAAMALAVAAMAGSAVTDRVYAAPPGSNEIRIGNTAPYTGPASAYGVIAKVIAAYLDKVNAEGGINGRKVNLITYDDAYEPTKTLDLTRKLVEEDQVLHFGDHRYEHERRDPALFEFKKGPAAFCLVGRSGLGPAARLSMDHGFRQATRLKLKFMRSICWRTILAARSPSFIRTTGWARNT